MADTTTEPAPIMDTFPVLVTVTTPEDKVEKVNEAVLLEVREIEKSGSVYSFVISGAEIIGSALITVIVKDTVFEEYWPALCCVTETTVEPTAKIDALSPEIDTIPGVNAE